MMMKVPLYVYSTKNLVGCGLALLMIGLYFAGVIQDFWWEITAGAYGVGALAAPGTSRLDVEMKQQMSDAELLAGLKDIAARAPRVLPQSVAGKVIAICATLTDVIPAVTRAHVGGETAYDVRTAATEYLPQTLAAYTRLPKAFRAVARLNDGKTADEMLDEQITVLEQQLNEIVKGVASADLSQLAANGRFLRDRFADNGLAKLAARA